MSASLSATHVDVRETQERIRRHASASFKFTGMTVVATVILTAALLDAQSKPVHAGGGLQAGPNAQAPGPADQSGFAAEIQWTLKKQHDQMIRIANRTPGPSDGRGTRKDQVIDQQIKVQSARAQFKNAQLTREVAEIAVTEYEFGVFPQDKATAEGALKFERDELSRALDSIGVGKDRLARIKQASKGSTADLASEFNFADILADAERRLPRAELAVKQAESKLKMLDQYTRPKSMTQLKLEVEKARSVELAAQAAWALEQSNLKRVEAATKAGELSARDREARDLLDRRALAALDRAISIDEQIRTKLEQLAKNGKPDDLLRKEIRDLANHLQPLIDQAEADQSAARFVEWKPRIHAAAN